MTTNIIVIAHHARFSLANKLANKLDAQIFLDEGDHGANWNHHNAIGYLNSECSGGIVIEDDAIPVPDFIFHANKWIERFPGKIISFYLGTGRPHQYQMTVRNKIDRALESGSDYITLPNLIHGVCYYVPSLLTKKILDNWDPKLPADFAVGRAYADDVIYPIYSLVQHSDIDSVEKHPDGQIRTERRQAILLYGLSEK